MCGIAGIWDGRKDAIGAMVTALEHRGPDDRGVFCDDRLALGATRLAIIDISSAGHQPMQNGDGSVILAYNGEMYNFREERDHLKRLGQTFSSRTDTEVVLRLYEHYGDDFLLRLHGMFAVAVYDRRGGPGRERLLLARDQLGIKPLLYARTGHEIVFASELKAILAGGLVNREVNPDAVRTLLTFGSVYQPGTIVRGVQMLPPAHRLVADERGIRIEQYWSLESGRIHDLSAMSYRDVVEYVAAALRETFARQLLADVPVGAFLSGGVDSSLLVALAAKEGGQPLRTFSVGFRGEGADIDESAMADRTAELLGADHTRVVVDGDDVRRRIDHIAGSLDQPSVDGVNSYFVSLAARKAVTVALSGTGGDELFAGYPWFLTMLVEARRAKRSPWVAAAKAVIAAAARRRIFDRVLGSAAGPWVERARTSAGFVSQYGHLYQIFGPDGAARLLGSESRKRVASGRSLDEDLRRLDELPNSPSLDRVTALCLRGYTNNQLLRDIDAVSMAHSLEVRVPYLDTAIVDIALSLPEAARLDFRGDGETGEGTSYRATGAKRVLIDVARPFLSAGFDDQPKRGFAMPFEAWLRGPLRDVLLDVLSEATVGARGILDPAEVRRVRDAFLQGTGGWAQPWTLMMLELWCLEVLDGPRVAAAA